MKIQLNFKRFWRWRWRDQALILGLVAAIFILNLRWVQLETRPPQWDMARHLWNSLVYLGRFKTVNLTELIGNYSYYPPLVYWLTIPIYLVFGISVASAVAINGLFLAVLALSTYGIGRQLWNRRAGLLAVVFLLTTPMMVSQFKGYELDGPVSALVALAIYLLIRSDQFSRRRFSLMFGLTCGLGLLTKWTFPLIMGLPILVAASQAALRSWRDRTWSRLTNLGWAALIAYSVACFWYARNWLDLRMDLLQNGIQQGRFEGDPKIGSLSANFWYLDALVNRQLYLIPLACLVIGLVVAVKRRQDLKRQLYPLLLVIGSYSVFALMGNKDSRYTLPMLVGVAILATYWISLLPRRPQKIVSGILIGYCLITFWAISFGIFFLPKQLNLNRPVKLAIWAQHGYILGAPTNQDWHLEEMFKLISSTAGGKRTSLDYQGPDTIWFNNWGLRYFALKYQVDFGPEPGTFFALRGRNLVAPSNYRLIKDFNLPDQTELRLYQHN